MDGKEGQKNQKKRRGFLLFGVLLAMILLVVLVLFYRDYRAGHISTDDAFVEGNIHLIASKVAGTVRAIPVKDNQAVKRGELLVEIDETDLEVKVREASTAVDIEKRRLSENAHRLETARRQVTEIVASLSAAAAGVTAQEANLRQAVLDMQRAENLLKSEAIPRERYDRTKTALEVNEAQLRASREQTKRLEASLAAQQSLLRQFEATLVTQDAVIKNKQAVFEGARLNRGYTKVLAPVDGYVTKKSVVPGNQITPGQPLMALVPLGDVWVIANYKETQLERVRPGQRVEITVDTYPGKTFDGVVESINAGTGSAFSLFPPENATGNYVKVVQRVPVKILLNKNRDVDRVLRIGMSVVPTIIAK